MIPYGRQSISEADIQAVVDVLQSEYLTQGPAVPAFEALVAKYCNVSHAIAVNSATSGLHIACLALGVGEGDIVWTSPITFVASANCALYCGAKVEFVDIDPKSYNISIEQLTIKLAEAEKSGTLPKVIIPVHLSGQPCEMKSIYNLAKLYGVSVIEDASHAIGAEYQNEPVGNCKYSDITVFSFHPVKIITTGEGGMSVTNSPELARKMQLLRSHGITREPSEMTHNPDGPCYYQQISLGFNYRMTDIQAALGISQLQKLDTFVNRRRELAKRYDLKLKDLPIIKPWQSPEGSSAWHLYIIRLKLNEIKSHRIVFEALRNAGIGVNLHYIPIYSQPYFQQFGYDSKQYPQAQTYYAEAISLPIYVGLTNQLQDQVITAIKEAITR
jgi:UDP-4-amino-4,6-dideoxy-N-acetyl-beta-L-altrosamine transaminase